MSSRQGLARAKHLAHGVHGLEATPLLVPAESSVLWPVYYVLFCHRAATAAPSVAANPLLSSSLIRATLLTPKQPFFALFRASWLRCHIAQFTWRKKGARFRSLRFTSAFVNRDLHPPCPARPRHRIRDQMEEEQIHSARSWLWELCLDLDSGLGCCNTCTYAQAILAARKRRNKPSLFEIRGI